MPPLIHFKDFPEFKPNLTPYEIFKRGSFGGTYFRKLKTPFYKRSLTNQHNEYKWHKKIDDDLLILPCDEYNVELNKYKVKVGVEVNKNCGFEYWIKKGWIKKQDPYGWNQWYCRFYEGRRTEDDERQIKRWIGIAGPRGRFISRYKNLREEGYTNKDRKSRVMLQILQHWAMDPR